ncbi:hypothetical protein ACWGJ2_39330 [Streptomyces sp. NPDC054796]
MFTARTALAATVLAAIAALTSTTPATATPGHTLPADSPGLLSGNA